MWYDEIDLGATVIFVVDKEKLTEEFALGFISSMRWFDKSKHAEEINKRAGANLLEDGTAGFRDPYNYFVISLTGFRASNDPNFRYDKDKIYFGLMTQERDAPLSSQKHIQRLLDECRRACEYLKPGYGWGEHFRTLLKYEGKDPRQHIFGYNYFGPEMVKKIGKDKLLNTPIGKKEEIAGGILLTLQENPFKDIKEDTRKELEHYLCEPLR